jgi:hypothetical protein
MARGRLLFTWCEGSGGNLAVPKVNTGTRSTENSIPFFRTLRVTAGPDMFRFTCNKEFSVEQLYTESYHRTINQSQSPNILSHVTEWLQMGFGLVTGFTQYLQIISTSNYSVITNSHTLQFTTTCTNSSQSAAFSLVVWYWLPTTASIFTSLWPVTVSPLTWRQ